MRAIVADTTPLNYLILIEAAEILPRLYGNVLIPPAVEQELTHPAAPELVRAWMARPPSWLEVRTVSVPADTAFLHLDAGEREAIWLALDSRAELLLMDDRDGAIAARQNKLDLVGTLGVLDLAAARGLIDLRVMFDRLLQTTFRAPRRLMASMLMQDAQRKKTP